MWGMGQKIPKLSPVGTLPKRSQLQNLVRCPGFGGKGHIGRSLPISISRHDTGFSWCHLVARQKLKHVLPDHFLSQLQAVPYWCLVTSSFSSTSCFSLAYNAGGGNSWELSQESEVVGETFSS